MQDRTGARRARRGERRSSSRPSLSAPGRRRTRQSGAVKQLTRRHGRCLATAINRDVRAAGMVAPGPLVHAALTVTQASTALSIVVGGVAAGGRPGGAGWRFPTRDITRDHADQPLEPALNLSFLIIAVFPPLPGRHAGSRFAFIGVAILGSCDRRVRPRPRQQATRRGRATSPRGSRTGGWAPPARAGPWAERTRNAFA